MSAQQGQRMEANCKIIWGNDCDYDLDIETDDYEYYQCHVKKDFGDSLGPPLVMTTLCSSSEAAWAELDRMLGSMAKQVTVKRETPMTEDQKAEHSGGSKGKREEDLKKRMEPPGREGAKQT